MSKQIEFDLKYRAIFGNVKNPLVKYPHETHGENVDW